MTSGVNKPERRSGTYLAWACVPVLIVKSTGTLST